MDLATFVQKYQKLAGGFERPVHLSRFGLSKPETEALISSWDEDYQISRYLTLSREKEDALVSYPEAQRVYLINGFEYSHVSFHPDIKTLL
jgi:hypothetical protein